MGYSSFININSLSEEARKELESFYEYLVFKYKKRKVRKSENNPDKNKFSAIQLDTIGFKFSREEANER